MGSNSASSSFCSAPLVSPSPPFSPCCSSSSLLLRAPSPPPPTAHGVPREVWGLTCPFLPSPPVLFLLLFLIFLLLFFLCAIPSSPVLVSEKEMWSFLFFCGLGTFINIEIICSFEGLVNCEHKTGSLRLM